MWNKERGVGSLNHYEKVSRFAKRFCLHHAEDEVIERAKLILLDSLAAMIHGNHTKEVYALINKLFSKQSHACSSTVFGTSIEGDPCLAAIVNGLGMVSEEMDEGNPIAKGHPSCHFLPALLAIAERDQFNGEQLLEAFIVGYEIGARAGAAIDLKENIHPHGNWGIIGAAFAIGKLVHYNEEDYLRALSLNGSMPYPTLWKPILEGHRVRDVFIGLNNLNAILMPSFVQSGYSGDLDSMEEIFRHIIGRRFDRSKLEDGLGDQYVLMQTYFKFYPFCRYCHSPIDAVLQLKAKETFSVESIDRVEVHTYSLASRLDGKHVRNEFAGKFSIPYAVAKTLVEAEENHPIENGVTDQKIVNLAKKINVFEDETLTALLPHQRNSRVEVFLKDGKAFAVNVQGAKGDWDDEGLKENVIQKCRDMISAIIGEEKAFRLIEQLLDLDNQSNMKEVLQLTKP